MSDDRTLFLDHECTLILLIASFLIEINAKYAKLIKIDKVKISVSKNCLSPNWGWIIDGCTAVAKLAMRIQTQNSNSDQNIIEQVQ